MKITHKFSIGGTPRVEDKVIKGVNINDIILDSSVRLEAGKFGIFPDDIAKTLQTKYPWLQVEDYVVEVPKKKNVKKTGKKVKK